MGDLQMDRYGLVKVKELEDELQHHGVMGMKWGVRRYQPYPSGKGPKGDYKGRPPKTKPETKNRKNIKAASKASGMSDKELRERINRIQMEKQYSQITAKDKAPGIKFAKAVLTTVAMTKATHYVSKNVDVAIPKIINSAKKTAVAGSLINDMRKYK